MLSQESNNIYNCMIKQNNTINNTKEKRRVYLKFSPLLDPLKYLLGNYDMNDVNLLNLPLYESNNSHPKVNETNNTAYVDSFFSYLTSKLLHTHGFIHGIDFYGSFLSMKENFRINILDDIDYLEDSEFFLKNNNKLYELENGELHDYDKNTRNYRRKINISSSNLNTNIDISTNILDLSYVSNVNEIDDIVSVNPSTSKN